MTKRSNRLFSLAVSFPFLQDLSAGQVVLAADRPDTGNVWDLFPSLFFATPRCLHVTAPCCGEFNVELAAAYCFCGVGKIARLGIRLWTEYRR